MTKKELIDALFEQTGVDRKQATLIIEALPKIVKEEIRTKGTSTLFGLGTFSVSERAARTGRNPQTGATLQIAAKKTVKMKPAADIRSSAE